MFQVELQHALFGRVATGEVDHASTMVKLTSPVNPEIADTLTGRTVMVTITRGRHRGESYQTKVVDHADGALQLRDVCSYAEAL